MTATHSRNETAERTLAPHSVEVSNAVHRRDFLMAMQATLPPHCRRDRAKRESNGRSRFRILVLVMRGQVEPVGRILPELVAHRAHRQPEYARRVRPLAVASRQRLQSNIALERPDGGS